MRAALLSILFVFSLASAQDLLSMPAPSEAREPNFGIYAAEAAGGLAGGLLGFAAGSAVGFILFWDYDHETSAIGGMLLIGAPVAGIGCAGGTYGLGSAFRQEGQFLTTLAWGVGSAVLGLGIYVAGVQLMNRPMGPEVVWDLGEVVMNLGWVAPVVLTTVGCNLSRPRDIFGGRFLPGSVALGSVTDADGAAQPSLDVRLVNFRF